MSIIQEALKKAQGEKDVGLPRPLPRQAERARHAQPVAAGAAAAKPASPRKTAAVSAVIILAAAIAVVSYAVWPRVAGTAGPDTTALGPVQEVSYRPLSGAAAARSAPDQAPGAGAKRADHAPAAPALVLNGIMYLEEGPRAIINNAIVGAGDSVSGAKVARIDRKKVVLVYNDLEITLNLK